MFLKVHKIGEQYSPPPNELGVVSNKQCTICKLPEMCLVYVANVVLWVQPHRACKQKPHPQHWQQLQPTGNTRNRVMEKPVLKAIEPEKKKCKVHEEIDETSLGGKLLGNVIMNAQYQD